MISKIVDYKINLKELVSYETLLVLKESYENDILEITIDKNNSEKDFNAVFDKLYGIIIVAQSDIKKLENIFLTF